jgi:Inosine-uridine nucleoside N-ribohydrolase
MINLINSVLSADEENYDRDYQSKACNNDIYKSVLEKCSSQIGMKQLFEYLKENHLLEYFFEKVNCINKERLYPSYTHGINHNLRVMLFSLYLSSRLNLNEEDRELIMTASAYHDIGRVDDTEDDLHGARSADKISALVTPDYKDIDMLKAVVELHSIDDKNFNKIKAKYNIKDEDRFRLLYSILKDTDALDRVRLSYGYPTYSSLNPNMLRNKDSYFLLKAAHEINEYYVKEYKKRYNIILDTDMENEIDDKFALVYLLNSLDTYDIEAITIAPFNGSKYSGVLDQANLEAGMDASYDTTLKIIDMMGVENKPPVYKGATGYIQEGYEEDNEAVRNIIEICSKNDETYIMAIGAITNVALAIKKRPDIAKKIKLVWLGGNYFGFENKTEFNFRQDIKAVQEVFNSDVELTVIPCVQGASTLITTIYELEHYLLDKGEVGKYLCEQYRTHKKELDGKSKTLWDLGAVGYFIKSDWFETDTVSRPSVNENGDYIHTDSNDKQATFVKRISRDGVYRDFFRKM